MAKRGSERFELTAPPPVRALAIGSVAILLGAALVVVAAVHAWALIPLLLGGCLVIFALSLLITAVGFAARLRSALVLDDDSVEVVRGRRSTRMPWTEVERVMQSGARLTLVRKGGERVSVVNLRSPGDPTFQALLAAIQARLDDSRGYQPLN